MSFQQGLSGLNSTSKSLDVIGNNIANANTFGSKVARAECDPKLKMSMVFRWYLSKSSKWG